MKEEKVKLQIRLDKKLVETAEAIFEDLGMDTTVAVRMFFRKVAATRSIPFPLKSEPAFSQAEEKRILDALEESRHPENLSGPYPDASTMFREIREEISAEVNSQI
jgi:DNA-damage-inducible protein J